MQTDLKPAPHDIHVGKCSFTHNRFLLLLALCALLAYLAAGAIGVPSAPGMNVAEKLWTAQMVWSLLVVPVSGIGSYLLKRAGHSDTALSCAVLTSGFIIGAVLKTFWM
ncbi:hypothetical protein [Pseudomonas mosselii]|uniref:hypothetical protein n=1 Tax=Pseudomonas mosselii TaxID=78327 RepID=UPI0021D8B924|nr:hypothetical protein [Pseudomonas mosselii]MCU9527601.1 hypothetical protein [Pseudomonas mosselii]MCU9534914.1 hypothetical protein [Pseudomonas mosselii]MCU9542417.1 hypothetical protein [Pseudomonas mosselii]MCU9546754.1 hypothetical protein [Pseudomonas mosselii]